MFTTEEFKDLLGKTLTEVKVIRDVDDEIQFLCADGSEYRLYHSQECCEGVQIEDICGDVADLIGSPLLQASEENFANNEVPPGCERKGYAKSFTWTFYKLATAKGRVTIRWYGLSNGYYSESVDFERTKEPASHE